MNESKRESAQSGDRAHHEIHYKVNDDEQETTQKQLTPRQIMSDDGIDPDQNYLVEIKGKERISFQENPTTPIDMHDGMRFVTVFTGPVPVSFSPNQGREEFERQLKEMGLNPKSDNNDNRTSFDYTIPAGRFAGRQVKIGFEVPPDFSRTPPGGPHISPRLLPINTNAPHPDRAHESNFGSDWEYLSRPYPNWHEGFGAAEYMAYVDHLFETT